jgi:hypothetical protein
LPFTYSTELENIQSESESLDDESPEPLFSLLSPVSLESLESFESLPLSEEESSSSEPDPCNENANDET